MLQHPDLQTLLERRQSPEIAAHLAACAACRVELRLFEQAGGSSPGEAGAPSATASSPSDAARYTELGEIGRGGMGVVRRVYDARLRRTVALKQLRPELARSERLRERFLAEAQATAQLQHPGVVPVHDLGTLPDGSPYFTMTELRGRTLAEAIRQEGADPAGRRRLLEALRAVALALAYAHERGLTHRDLKPGNVLLGDFGEVVVLDWGLASAEGGQLSTALTDAPERATLAGAALGTPAYMAPEAARGEPGRDAARVDVYGLGAVLYEILAGAPPARGSAAEILEHLRGDPPAPDPRAEASQPVPEPLARLCLEALEPDPARRTASARAFADRLGAWLEGTARREQALALVEQAEAGLAEAAAAREQAEAAAARAARQLEALGEGADEAAREQAWEEEDEAARRLVAADAVALEAEQTLRAALSFDPELPVAHALLAERARLAAAARQGPARQEAEAALRAHAEALPAAHPDRARHLAWLVGDGALTLLTDPPGAEVLLEALVPRRRRLVAEPRGGLGHTPLEGLRLPMGSWRLRLRLPGYQEVLYPVVIDRQERWDGVPPGERAPRPIPLPPLGALSPDEIYVPAGWFWSGDPQAPNGLPRRRIWLEGFVIRRFPVTQAEFLAFCQDVHAREGLERALALAPRSRRAEGGPAGPAVHGLGPDGRLRLVPDPDGDLWRPDWPAFLVDWHAARACARWRAAQDGLPWRLPRELEREKAGRGVDGRIWPWGDHFVPGRARLRDPRASSLLSPVHSFPEDQSPYGVRGVAGGIQDWCADPWREEGHALPDGRQAPLDEAEDGALPRTFRGGAWSLDARWARLGSRGRWRPEGRAEELGFRLAREAPPWGG